MNLIRYLLPVWMGVLSVPVASAAAPSPEQQQCLAKARRFERHGWIYLHVEGEPKDRGFQHGYLLAPEIAEGLRITRAGWEHDSAMTWSWLVERAGGDVRAEN